MVLPIKVVHFMRPVLERIVEILFITHPMVTFLFIPQTLEVFMCMEVNKQEDILLKIIRRIAVPGPLPMEIFVSLPIVT